VPNLRLNLAQRIILIVALGGGLLAFGRWATTRGAVASGWVAYAPLSNNVTVPGGLHPWVRLVIWVALIVVWAVASMYVLPTRSQNE
jgi:heme/copper-type cytochrome/quinol oxidase subunit 1